MHAYLVARARAKADTLTRSVLSLPSSFCCTSASDIARASTMVKTVLLAKQPLDISLHIRNIRGGIV